MTRDAGLLFGKRTPCRVRYILSRGMVSAKCSGALMDCQSERDRYSGSPRERKISKIYVYERVNPHALHSCMDVRNEEMRAVFAGGEIALKSTSARKPNLHIKSPVLLLVLRTLGGRRISSCSLAFLFGNSDPWLPCVSIPRFSGRSIKLWPPLLGFATILLL
jgi:hypothetical protein